MKISCGKCEKCLELRPERCHAIVGKPKFREVQLGATAIKDANPRTIERRASSGMNPAFEVGDSEARRKWTRAVRRLICGVGMAWWDVRDRFGNDRLRKLCLDGIEPQAAADLIMNELKH